MIPQTISLDADSLLMTPDGREAVILSELEAAALRLLHDGFDTTQIAGILGIGTDAALARLQDSGVTMSGQIELQSTGHIFHSDPVAPNDRHLAGALAARLRLDPDAEALVLEQKDGTAVSVTVAELSALVDELAGRFSGEGIGPGSHIALDATPSLENTALAIAAWEAGASVVIVRPTLPDASLEVIARDIAPKVWFMARRPGMPEDGVQVDPDPQTGRDALGAWIDSGPTAGERPTPDPDREAVVMTSSGSTGLPKMIALTHRGLAHSARYGLRTDNLQPGDRVSASIDMSAISGLRIFTVLPALGPTATFIPMPQTRTSSLALLEVFGSHDVRHARLVPANIRAIVQLGRERLGALGLDTLDGVASGGSALHPDIRREAADITGAVIRDHYGMTETAGSFCNTADGAVSANGALAQDILIRLVDADGAATPTGEIGHIRFFDACLSPGEYTSEGFKDRTPGWFTSGDMGRRGEDGRIIVAGRSDAMMKTREGEFLAPAAIVNIVSVLPFVDDAAVLPGKDRDSVDNYALAIETGDDADFPEAEITDAIAGTLGRFALPKRIVALPAFPRIAQGKPDLMELKEIAKRRD